MDLCLSCWKETRRIEVRAEGAAFVFWVFGHYTTECIGLTAARRGARVRPWSKSAEVFGFSGLLCQDRSQLQLPRCLYPPAEMSSARL